VSALTFTPELLRNGRIQLRRGRVLAVIVICAAVSLSAVAYFFYSPDAARSEMAALNLVRTMVILQITVLLIGGGIYCLQSVHREKELNTFDYQRITRLKPIELAILLLGSITFHAMALLLSLLVPRGSSAGSSLFFLVLIGMGSIFGTGISTFAIHQVSPFFAVELLPSQGPRNSFAVLPPSEDLFLGTPVPHFLVLIVLYVTFWAFFLLAIARNIKRDPSIYEIYAPWQGLVVVLYLNALVLSFFRWTTPLFTRSGVQFQPISADNAELTLLMMALWLFAIFGFALLRNRERARRRIRQYGAMAAGWWAAVWPSPYLLAGVLATGCAILAMIQHKVEKFGNWNLQVGILEVAFFAIWLVRDFQYLQWMNLQRARRPLVAGVLYLIIFYVCASACMAAFGLYRPFAAPYRAIFIPSAAFGLDADAWASAERLWMGALLLLVIETFAFVWLQRRELEALGRPSG
jgi:hypothetical protein